MIPSDSAQLPAFAVYLRAVADALAAPGATADSVLAAAGARDIERGRDVAYFRTPDPRVTGSIELHRPSDPRTSAGTVTFESDPDRPRVTLGEITAAFGAWRPGVRPTSLAPLQPVLFTAPYRPAGTGRSDVRAVSVAADLYSVELTNPDLVAHPPPPGIRVTAVHLRPE